MLALKDINVKGTGFGIIYHQVNMYGVGRLMCRVEKLLCKLGIKQKDYHAVVRLLWWAIEDLAKRSADMKAATDYFHIKQA